jgi:hypothetical protein
MKLGLEAPFGLRQPREEGGLVARCKHSLSGIGPQHFADIDVEDLGRNTEGRKVWREVA